MGAERMCYLSLKMAGAEQFNSEKTFSGAFNLLEKKKKNVFSNFSPSPPSPYNCFSFKVPQYSFLLLLPDVSPGPGGFEELR